MGMALLAAVAAGLNPYATLFLVAALATYLASPCPGWATPSPPVLIAVVAVAGLALPLDLVLGKLIRRRSRNPAPALPPLSQPHCGKRVPWRERIGAWPACISSDWRSGCCWPAAVACSPVPAQTSRT